MTDFYDRMRQENEARINAETGGADDNDDAVGSSIIDILLRAQRNPEPGTKVSQYTGCIGVPAMPRARARLVCGCVFFFFWGGGAFAPPGLCVSAA